MKKSAFILITILILFWIGCAPGPNTAITAEQSGEPAGFFLGLWHGLIAFITFIISLFNKNINIYEVNNTGNMYNFGFILGVVIAFGGSQRTAKRKQKSCC